MRTTSISQVDALFASGAYPIEFLLYYDKPVSGAALKTALRRLADDFWPAFGRYHGGEIVRDGYLPELHVREIIDQRVFDSGASAEQLQALYGSVNPQVDRELFFLTVLQHKNGTVLLPKLSHLAGDGYSYFYLLSALAAGVQAPRNRFKAYLLRRLSRPRHDRTNLRRFRFAQRPPAYPPSLGDSRVELMTLDRAELDSEVAALNQSKISANDLLSAHVLKELTQRGLGAYNPRGRVGLVLPIDMRRALRSLGQRFFGNGLQLHRVTFRRDSVLELGAATLAKEIRDSLPTLDRGQYITYLARLEDELADGSRIAGPYDPESDCLVTNLTRLPTSRLDFGGGPPSRALPLTLAQNSAAILVDGDRYVLRLVV